MAKKATSAAVGPSQTMRAAIAERVYCKAAEGAA